MAKSKKVVAEVETLSEVEIESLEDGIELSADPSEISAVVEDIEIEEAKTAAYEAMEGDAVAIGESVPTDPTATVAAKPAKVKAPKAPKVPRVSLGSGAKASDVITARVGGDSLVFHLDSTYASDEDAISTVKANVLAKIDTLDKKSREKAINVFAARVTGKKPSVYTMQALEALKSAGTLSLKDLVGVYLAKDYKAGTARRQASEMFALFPVLQIAQKDAARGSPLVFNEGSTLARQFLAS